MKVNYENKIKNTQAFGFGIYRLYLYNFDFFFLQNILRFWLNKGASGFRMDAVNHIFEVDKADFGGQFPDEPLSGNPDQGPDDYGYLNHIYTINLNDTYNLIYDFREVFDEFLQQDGFTRVILTEAYADIKETMKYYGNGARKGSHMPFNFALIENVNEFSSAKDIKFYTDRWLTYMPVGMSANWVVSISKISYLVKIYV